MKIRVIVYCKAPRIFEIDDSELDGLDDDERREEIDKEAHEVANEMLDWGWEEVCS